MHRGLVAAIVTCSAVAALAQSPSQGPVRQPVLRQVGLPHNYYYRELYLPQLTTGPSSACWTPDGEALVFAMQGSLWRLRLGTDVAEQLTDAAGADYQPDCAPDGRGVVFVRYDGRSMALWWLDLATGAERALTRDDAVNVEPRWSPDGRQLAFVSTAGTGHFLLHVADVTEGRVTSVRTVTPDRRSQVARYYYSPFDHAINPAWTRDGRALLFVSNREVAHGTGDLVRRALDGPDEAPQVVRQEETSWRMRPDVSPDGMRIVYASYLGGQWHQLWVLPVGGGHAFPLTYGDHDDTNPRWSPDGRRIAFISNRGGNTSLWFVDAFSGEQTPVRIGTRRFLRPHRALMLRVQDERGAPMPARVSITDSRHRAYAPDDAWLHADDLLVPERQAVETRYFHTEGESAVAVPLVRLAITVARGPRYEVAHLDVDARDAERNEPVVVKLRRLALTSDQRAWWNGDLHVHMNYGGHYRNTPEGLARMARAEDVDLVYNQIVNKEQRVPDVASFGTDLASAGGQGPVILHGQEFHSSYWGHLGLLGLTRHLLLPGYTAYPFTAVASPYPHNAVVADMAHRQGALVGYVHPFDEDVDPEKAATLTNALPVDAALGKIDYYEAVGFSDHKASSAVWYRLLDCGLELPAAAGTDAMANYASLRGPVGLNRVFVPASGALTGDAFLAAVGAGRGMATNGPLVDLTVGDAKPGDTVTVAHGGLRVAYSASLRSNVAVDHLELVWNGEVAARLSPGRDGQTADVQGTIVVDGAEPDAEDAGTSVPGGAGLWTPTQPIELRGSGWLVLRAWNSVPNDDVLDIYPFATTSPIYVSVEGRPRRSRGSAEYFLRWLDRIEQATRVHPDYRGEQEREAVLADVARARPFYEACARDADPQRR
jgi:Tol biopolymer transport system component